MESTREQKKTRYIYYLSINNAHVGRDIGAKWMRKNYLDSSAGGCTPGSAPNSLVAHGRRGDLSLGLVKRVSLLIVVLVNLAIYPQR